MGSLSLFWRLAKDADGATAVPDLHCGIDGRLQDCICFQESIRVSGAVADLDGGDMIALKQIDSITAGGHGPLPRSPGSQWRLMIEVWRESSVRKDGGASQQSGGSMGERPGLRDVYEKPQPQRARHARVHLYATAAGERPLRAPTAVCVSQASAVPYSLSRRATRSLPPHVHVGEVMKRFRCFFINEDDTVGSFEPLEVERDEDAILRAEAMLSSQYSASAAELWAEGHLVARVQRPDDWI